MTELISEWIATLVTSITVAVAFTKHSIRIRLFDKYRRPWHISHKYMRE